jgi:hypothetical protein
MVMRGSMHHCLLATLATLAASVVVAAEDGSGAVADLEGDHFAVGAAAALTEPITGDALLAGATVESNASVGGDAILAGGTVAVRATVGEDLYVAGGDVEVDALVAGDARIAAARLTIAPETHIEGSAALAGGHVEIDGSIGRYLTVAGGDVVLGGTIAGEVHVYADELTVKPGTRIGGRLVYRTSRPVTLPPDVQVQGGVAPSDDADAGRVPGGEGRHDANGAGRLGWLWLAGLFAVGWLLALAFAQFSRRTTAVLTARPWQGIGIGATVLFGVPALAIALFVTIVGIPLALILLMLYLGSLIGGYVIGVLYLGDRALATARPGRAVTTPWRLGAFLAVLLALSVVGSLPVLGSLARFAVLALGMGGVVLALWPGQPATGTSGALPAA